MMYVVFERFVLVYENHSKIKARYTIDHDVNSKTNARTQVQVWLEIDPAILQTLEYAGEISHPLLKKTQRDPRVQTVVTRQHQRRQMQ